MTEHTHTQRAECVTLSEEDEDEDEDASLCTSRLIGCFVRGFTSVAPLRHLLHKQDNLESFSSRPGNVNRLRGNITPAGVHGSLRE